MKIVNLLQQLQQRVLGNLSHKSNALDAMDRATQRIQNAQHLVLLKTDYLE